MRRDRCSWVRARSRVGDRGRSYMLEITVSFPDGQTETVTARDITHRAGPYEYDAIPEEEIFEANDDLSTFPVAI